MEKKVSVVCVCYDLCSQSHGQETKNIAEKKTVCLSAVVVDIEFVHGVKMAKILN